MRQGDKVVDRYDNLGTVRRMFDDFKAAASGFITMEPETWLREQALPVSKEELKEPWIEVLCDDGGATLSPLSSIKKV